MTTSLTRDPVARHELSAWNLPALFLCVCMAACGSPASRGLAQTQRPQLTRLDLLAGQPGGRGWVDGALVDAHFQEPWQVIGDGANTLYVADANIIRAIDCVAGTVTTLAGSYGHVGASDGTGAGATFSLPSGLAFAGGILYMSDTENSTVRQIDVTTGVVTTLAGTAGQRGSADGPAAGALFGEPEGIALDSTGVLYIADTDNNLIRALDLNGGTVSTVAGNPNQSGFTDGIGAAATFNKPKDLKMDGEGNLYVADAFNTAVRKVVPSTGLVSTLAIFESVPQGIAVDGSDLLVSLQGVSGDNRVVRVASDGTVSTVAGTANGPGFVDGIGEAARLDSPAGLYNDGAGNLYIADSANFVVRKMTIASGSVATYAGALSVGSADGTGNQARFSAPQGLAVDDRTVYVADTGNHTIRAIELATGNVTTLAGVAGQSGHVDGPLGTARFNGPLGLALDTTSQMLYVAETLNRAIRRIDLAKGAVTTLSYLGPESLDGPSGLALDGTRLFVADADDDVVVEIDLQKAQISLVAGQVDTPGTEDGVGPKAAFNTPTGVGLDGRGNLYVADNQASTVRRVALASSAVSTIAGSPNVVMHTDGVGEMAYFSHPFAVTANDLGDLFVSDTNSNAVRHMDLGDGAVTTVIGSADAPGVRLGILPAQLALPSAVALAPTGSLLVVSENSVLIAHGP